MPPRAPSLHSAHRCHVPARQLGTDGGPEHAHIHSFSSPLFLPPSLTLSYPIIPNKITIFPSKTPLCALWCRPCSKASNPLLYIYILYTCLVLVSILVTNIKISQIPTQIFSCALWVCNHDNNQK